MPSSRASAATNSGGRRRGRPSGSQSTRRQASISNTSVSTRSSRRGPSLPNNTSSRGNGRQQSVNPTGLAHRSQPSSQASRGRSSFALPLANHQGRVPDENNDPSEHSDDTVSQEVIMAINMKENAIMGCAYFNTLDSVLYLSEDIPMANTDIAEQFLLHAHPTTLLISARAPESFQVFLEKLANTPQSDDLCSGFILRGLQSSEFSPESAKQKLVQLKLDTSLQSTAAFSAGTSGFEDNSSGQESVVFKSLRCGASVNLNSQVSVGCAGAVLADLHRRRSAGFLPDGQVAEIIFHVSSVRMFSLSSYMFVNADALLSLQIVQTELHPNSQAWGSDAGRGNSKESLSVYGLFHHLACTPQGRTQLRQLFLRPVLDIDVISERQKLISVLLQPENADTVRQITSTLRKIRNLRTNIAQLQRGNEFPTTSQSFEKGAWGSIRRFTVEALSLRELVGSLNGGSQLRLIRKLQERLPVAELVSIGDIINNTIDFEQSKSRYRPSVRTGIDPQLDELKRRYDGMESFLSQASNQMIQELPEWARQYIRCCVYLPQLGFLTVVEPHPDTGQGLYEGEGTDQGAWERLFTLDDAVCYKNHYMKELDEEYGDMYCHIGDREVEIIHGLATRTLQHEDMLLQASDVCGECDALLALASGAEKYGWRAPCVVEESIILIEDGRHPLQELVVPAFVPNDCQLAAGCNDDHDIIRERPKSAMVLTGPNHSGKSVYLKQVAIIAYLAHIGSFVPANEATIGLTDKILTRISTKESMSGAESAFAIDLRQVALSTRCCTPRSLVLVDEFGKGTNVDDGAGLLAATLDHFLSLGQDSPRLLVATHFHEVFDGRYLDQHQGLSLAHMNVKVDWDMAQIEDQVTYLFRLAHGHSTSSFGSRCAALNGVPTSVVDRAEAIAVLLARNEDLGAICTRLSRDEEKRLEQAENTARRFLGEEFGGDEAIASRVPFGSMKATLESLLTPLA